MLRCQETLRNLRQTENNRQLENWKIQQLEAKPVTEAKTDMETEEQPHTQSRRETFVDELTEELIMPQSINGMLAPKEAEEEYQLPYDGATNNPLLSFWHSQPNVSHRKSANKGFANRQQAVRGYEWIEMGVRREVHMEEEEKRGQRVIWNHRAQSVPNLDHLSHNIAADPIRYNTRPHTVLYPDVDYPMEEDSTVQPPYQAATSREGPESTKRDSDSQSVNQDSRRNSYYSQSGDVEASHEAWAFSKNLRSPGLRRRRPVSTHQGPSTHTSRQFFPGSAQSWSTFSHNSNLKRNSVPPGSDSHRVLKLGSLKPNQGMFWNMYDRVSPDPQTLSESELPDRNFYNNRAKTKRSASIPNIVIEGGHGRLYSSSLSTLHQVEDVPYHISRHNSYGHHSPLQGLLERAKERDGFKRDRNVKTATLRSRYPPPSPSFSTTPSPSPSPSEGDRDTEWEEEVELMRHRALTVSKGWKEQLVDGDDDDKRNRLV